jgi:phage gpG-like protein
MATPNKHAHEFDDIIRDIRALRLRIIRHAAAMALAFFKQSFVNQGFTDNGLQKWNKRIPGTPNNSGRGLLFGSGPGAGTLKRSLRIKKADESGAIVSVDDAIPYADIQNFGGKIPVTPQMRRFFWAMYYKSANGITYDVKTRGVHNTKKNNALNDQANFWKSLALTKEKFINLPARQFIGDSATLERQIVTYITQELDKFFKTDH